MIMSKNQLLSRLADTVTSVLSREVPDERKVILDELITYIQKQKRSGKTPQLNFICTHNSRRSQLSQVWAKVAGYYFGEYVLTYSGGVEVTAFNHRGVESLRRMGFVIGDSGGENPVYRLLYADGEEAITAFSKLYDDESSPKSDFAAVMTCSHADENCPFIAGADARIPVRYEDPKAFDDTPEEAARYDERSLQIASEMFYVFSQMAEK